MVTTPWNTLANTLSPTNKEAQVFEQDYTKLALRSLNQENAAGLNRRITRS